MKNKINIFLGLLFRLVYAFHSGVIFKKGYLLFCKVSIPKTNKLWIEEGFAKKSNFFVEGDNNTIHLSGVLNTLNIKIFGKSNTIVIEKGCELGKATIVIRGNNCKIFIGSKTTALGMYMVCMGVENSISIGEDCMFAENVEIWSTDSHAIFDNQKIMTNPSKPISIGNHVWVGKHASIMKGVSIGNDAIIGMRSVVTKNIQERTLCAGIPARVLHNDVTWSRKFITDFECM